MWVGPEKNIKVVPRKSINRGVIQELLSDQQDKCRLCKLPIFMGTYSNSDVDHIIPLKHGGSSDPGNLQVLCVTCHRRKTALECKKVVTIMGDDKKCDDGNECNMWGSKLYLSNSRIHFEPDSITDVAGSTPKNALEYFDSRIGLFITDGGT